MPIYEYSCGDCGEKFEKLVRLSDSTPDIECPKCGSKNAKKALSLFGMGAGKSGGGSFASSGGSCATSGST